MPFGNNDWLALTQEDPIEPDIPLCDPHHHFWDGRMQSIPYQRYLIHELMADLNSGHNVRSTVFLEARSMYRASGPEELRSVGEVEFVQGLAAASASGTYGETRAAATIIGAADLKMGDGVARVLEALQAASPNRFKGIRHNVTWSPDPEIDNREEPGVLASDSFRAGARVLARMGLSLDIMLAFPQMNEVAEFARAVPEVSIILNHLGGVSRTGIYAGKDDEIIPAWREGIAAVAQNPNVTCKLGGMGMPRWGFDWPYRTVPIGSEELAEGHGAVDELRHRAVRPGALYVREQLPARQGVLLLQRHVQRLQAPLQRLQPQRAGRHAPRHRGQGVPDRDVERPGRLQRIV